MLVACASLAEAHYLCALVNSAAVGRSVRRGTQRAGGKDFGTPGMLDVLPLRRFDPADPGHVGLSSLGRQAHDAVGRGDDPAAIQAEIDRVAGVLWEKRPA